MQELNLMSEGAELAVVGMSTVFFFLTTLVFTTELMSRIVTLVELADKKNVNGPTPGEKAAQKVAAVAAAVHKHRGL